MRYALILLLLLGTAFNAQPIARQLSI